jgi:hypothetical protein
MQDITLHRWSGVLLMLAILTIVISFIAPVVLLSGDAPLILAKGADIWRTTLSQLPRFEGALCVVITSLPNIAWVYCVVQILLLARLYRSGKVFTQENTRYFRRIGVGLTLMGFLSALMLPIIGYMLYYRGISPWLPDMPLLTLFEPDLLMAGVFFYVLGKIMQRGVELQENDDLTV